MTIRIGTSGWSYAHWKGGFYPEQLAQSRWFGFYAEHFNSVEVNATFYRMFKDSTYLKWRDLAPQDFRYVLKVPRLISHRHKLHEVEGLIAEFCRSAGLLGNRLGLLLLQLPPNMPCKPERLAAVLDAFETPSRVAVEFRDERWLTDEIFSLLENRGAIYCNPDYPQHPLTGILTGQDGYLRLHGRRNWYTDDYDHEALHAIAQTAQQMQQQGAKEIYIFFNNDYTANAPRNAAELMRILHVTQPDA